MRFTLVTAALVGAAALLATACGGNDGQGSPTASSAATGSPLPLSLDDWAEQVCALATEAAGTLDVPGPENHGTLAERKQWFAEVVAPRAEALALTAEDIAGLQPPRAVVEYAGGFTDFHSAFQVTVADIAAAWQELVDTAEGAQSAEEIDAAGNVFTRAKGEAIAGIVPLDNAWLVSAEMRAALSQPQDCGFLR